MIASWGQGLQQGGENTTCIVVTRLKQSVKSSRDRGRLLPMGFCSEGGKTKYPCQSVQCGGDESEMGSPSNTIVDGPLGPYNWGAFKRGPSAGGRGDNKHGVVGQAKMKWTRVNRADTLAQLRKNKVLSIGRDAAGLGGIAM